MKRTAKCFFTGCLALLASSDALRAELKLVLSEEGLRVEGADPGAEVALLSVWLEVESSGPHSRQTVVEDAITDDDRDGIVEFEVDRAIPIASIWGVIDSATGESAVVAPTGFALVPIPPAKEAAFGKQLGRLVVMRTELEVLLVRPGLGRWRGRQRDGLDSDRDGRLDRGVTIDLDVLREEKGDGDSGPKLAEGDTVIAIDPIRMQVLNLRLQ